MLVAAIALLISAQPSAPLGGFFVCPGDRRCGRRFGEEDDGTRGFSLPQPRLGGAPPTPPPCRQLGLTRDSTTADASETVIEFDPGSARLSNAARGAIRTLVRRRGSQGGALSVHIALGEADGGADVNALLQARGAAVRTYLERRGVAKNSIDVIGWSTASEPAQCGFSEKGIALISPSRLYNRGAVPFGEYHRSGSARAGGAARPRPGSTPATERVRRRSVARPPAIPRP